MKAIRSACLSVTLGLGLVLLSCNPVAATAASKSGAGVAAKQKHGSRGLQSGYQEYFLFRVRLLLPVVTEMSDTLEPLHAQYAQQFALCRRLVQRLPDTDPLKAVMHRRLADTETFLLSIASYAGRFKDRLSKIEQDVWLQKQPKVKAVLAAHLQMDALLSYLEKISFFEIQAQRDLDGLFDLLSRRWNIHSGKPPFGELRRFNALRQKQVKAYFESRKQYEKNIRFLSALKGLYDQDSRSLLQRDAQRLRELAAGLKAGGRTPDSRNAQVDPEVSGLLAGLAERQAEGRLAQDALFSTIGDNDLWSLLYVPEENRGASIQRRMATRLVAVLEEMRPALSDLAGLLARRNNLLFSLPAIAGDDARWLRESIALESVGIQRLADVTSRIDALKKKAPHAVAGKALCAAYEQLGYLKEDILSWEVSIGFEISRLIKKNPSRGKTRNAELNRVLEAVSSWFSSWPARRKQWNAAVDDFNRYQVSVIERYVGALENLNSYFDQNHEPFRRSATGAIREFLNLVEARFGQRLDEYRATLKTKREMMARTAVDPVFRGLFGISADQFWHEFRGQGAVLFGLEQLIGKTTDIKKGIQQLAHGGEERAVVLAKMLQVASWSDLVLDIRRNPKRGIRVLLELGEKGRSLEGFSGRRAPRLTPPPGGRMRSCSGSDAWLNRFDTLFSVSPAHAGFFDSVKSWGGAVYTQVRKNAVNYVIIGAVAVGSLAAGPAAPVVAGAALAAFKAQATADVALATARTVGNAIVKDPKVRRTMNERIDTLETIYNVAKIVEGGRNAVRGYWAEKEITKGAVKFSDKISITLRNLKAENNALIRKANKIREFLNKYPRSPATQRRALQMLDEISGRANSVREMLARGGSKIAERVNDFIKAAQRGMAANDILGAGATGYGLLPGEEGGGEDECPDDPQKTAPGICGCGTPDTDSDKDGLPDCIDKCKDDAGKTEPGECGCGVSEEDGDGDGVPDCVDKCPEDAQKSEPGECGCGVSEEDGDGDGVPDCVDKCPEDAEKSEPGECGCGVSEEDSDGDGVPDCVDKCPEDPEKADPGQCGCGKVEDDSDGDGTADCVDPCPQDPNKTDPGQCGCGKPEDSCQKPNEKVENLKDSEEETSNPAAGAAAGVPGPNVSVPDTGSGNWSPTNPNATLSERSGSAEAANANAQVQIAGQGQLVDQSIASTANQSASANAAAQTQRAQSSVIVDSIIGGLTSGVAAGVDAAAGVIGAGAGVKVSEQINPPKPSTDTGTSTDSGSGSGETDTSQEEQSADSGPAATSAGLDVQVVGTAPPGQCQIVAGQLVPVAGYPKRISGMTVSLSGPVSRSTVSSGSGSFSFPAVPAGDYTISVAGWDYGMTSASLTAPAGKAIRIVLKGSCPYLYVWTGDAFSRENDVYSTARLRPAELFAALGPKEKITASLRVHNLGVGAIPDWLVRQKSYTDYYRIARRPVKNKAGDFVLKLVERAGENSFTDFVKLQAVAVGSGLQAAVDREGRYFYYHKPLRAVESFSTLKGSADGRLHENSSVGLYDSQSITLEIPREVFHQGVLAVQWQGFLDGVSMAHSLSSERPRLMLQRQNTEGVWEAVAWDYPRDEVTWSFFRLTERSGWDRDGRIRLKVKSCLPSKFHSLINVMWSRLASREVHPVSLALKSARTGKSEDVRGALLDSDGRSMHLSPAHEAVMVFDGNAIDSAREYTYFFIARGFYIPAPKIRISANN